MESLMNQRFNFFLIFSGLVVNASVNSQDVDYFKGILIAGALIAALMAWPIFRAHQKMGTIFKLLKEDPRHPMTFVDRLHDKKLSARWVIGWGIPLLTTVALTLFALLAFCGIVSPPKVLSQTLTNERIAHLEATVKNLTGEKPKVEIHPRSTSNIQKLPQPQENQVQGLPTHSDKATAQ